MSEQGKDTPESLRYTANFLGAMQQVDDYNRLNVNVMRGDSLQEYIASNPSWFDHSDPFVIDEKNDSQTVDAIRGLVVTENHSFLTEIGVDFHEPLSWSGGESTLQSDRSPYLKLRIADEDKFIAGVHSFCAIPERQTEINMSVALLIADYLNEIKHAYIPRVTDDPDPAKVTMRRVMADIQLERLPELQEVLARLADLAPGCVDLVNRLALQRCEVYSQHWQNGTFSDYIQAESKGLMSPWRDGWHTDLDARYFTYEWKEALSYLATLRDREPQSALYPELLAKLQADFKVATNAIMDIQPLTNSPYVREEPYWAKSIAEIHAMRTALTETIAMWEAQFNQKFTHPNLGYESQAATWPNLSVPEIISLLPDKLKNELTTYAGFSRTKGAYVVVLASLSDMEQFTLQAFGLAAKDEALSESVRESLGKTDIDDPSCFMLDMTSLGEEVMDALHARNE